MPCPKCGVKFNCGMETGKCWCTEITLDEAAKAQLPPEELCLCPNCLQALAHHSLPDEKH